MLAKFKKVSLVIIPISIAIVLYFPGYLMNIFLDYRLMDSANQVGDVERYNIENYINIALQILAIVCAVLQVVKNYKAKLYTRIHQKRDTLIYFIASLLFFITNYFYFFTSSNNSFHSNPIIYILTMLITLSYVPFVFVFGYVLDSIDIVLYVEPRFAVLAAGMLVGFFSLYCLLSSTICLIKYIKQQRSISTLSEDSYVSESTPKLDKPKLSLKQKIMNAAICCIPMLKRISLILIPMGVASSLGIIYQINDLKPENYIYMIFKIMAIVFGVLQFKKNCRMNVYPPIQKESYTVVYFIISVIAFISICSVDFVMPYRELLRLDMNISRVVAFIFLSLRDIIFTPVKYVFKLFDSPIILSGMLVSTFSHIVLGFFTTYCLLSSGHRLIQILRNAKKDKVLSLQ